VSRITTIAVCVVLVATGLAYGRITDRWGVPASVSSAGERLNRLPTTIGGWTSTQNEVSSRVLKVAGAQNIIDRSFSSPDNDLAHVMIVCGRPGPVTRHPPTVCFTSQGMRQATPVKTDRATDTPEDVTFEFAHCVFETPQSPAQFDTRWAFSADGRHWQMPENPRVDLANKAWLYKLYVVTTASEDAGVLQSRQEFMNRLLVELAAIQD
jgi:hypothetical protein